jgi:hypothetical protein
MRNLARNNGVRNTVEQMADNPKIVFIFLKG